VTRQRRPALRRVPLAEVLPLGVRPEVYLTMRRRQWDALLARGYEAGCILLELDAQERPVAAFHRNGTSGGAAA
jgi:hypothetical protein